MTAVMTKWNAETEAISQWLDRPEVKPELTKLVLAWNGLELLGIDLADQIEKMVRESATRELSPLAEEKLSHVDWGHLAEHYAWEICYVDEAELTRRRVEAGGEP